MTEQTPAPATEPRPNFVTDQMLAYLYALRRSGATNMFGAAPYLREAFPGALTKHTAREALSYWMRTFSEAEEARLKDVDPEDTDIELEDDDDAPGDRESQRMVPRADGGDFDNLGESPDY